MTAPPTCSSCKTPAGRIEGGHIGGSVSPNDCFGSQPRIAGSAEIRGVEMRKLLRRTFSVAFLVGLMLLLMTTTALAHQGGHRSGCEDFGHINHDIAQNRLPSVSRMRGT